MAYADLRYSGWPNNLVPSVQLFESKNGHSLEGDVQIGFTKRNVIHVKAGEIWKSQGPINCEHLAQQKYEWLVVVHEGNIIARRFLKESAVTVNKSSIPRAQQTEPKQQTFIQFTGVELVKKDGGKRYDVVVNGLVESNHRPVKQAQLEAYYEGKIEPKSLLTPGIRTNDSGRFEFTFENKFATGKRLKVEFQVRGGTRREHPFDMPAAPEPDKPKAAPVLTAFSKIQQFGQPVPGKPDQMQYTLVWTNLDQYGKPFSGPATVIFKGAQREVRQVDPQRPGVCIIIRWVTGYDAEESLALLPTVGEPTIEVLKGPKETRKAIDTKDRFKAGVEGDEIAAKKFYAVIPLETFDKYGEASASKVEVTLVNGKHATFTDASTGTILADKAKYCVATTGPDGRFRLGVEFKGQFEVAVELYHPDSKQKRTLKLVYKQ
jgi:hypothetical protein